jgi:hypothetical protein
MICDGESGIVCEMLPGLLLVLRTFGSPPMLKLDILTWL